MLQLRDQSPANTPHPDHLPKHHHYQEYSNSTGGVICLHDMFLGFNFWKQKIKKSELRVVEIPPSHAKNNFATNSYDQWLGDVTVRMQNL